MAVAAKALETVPEYRGLAMKLRRREAQANDLPPKDVNLEDWPASTGHPDEEPGEYDQYGKWDGEPTTDEATPVDDSAGAPSGGSADGPNKGSRKVRVSPAMLRAAARMILEAQSSESAPADDEDPDVGKLPEDGQATTSPQGSGEAESDEKSARSRTADDGCDDGEKPADKPEDDGSEDESADEKKARMRAARKLAELRMEAGVDGLRAADVPREAARIYRDVSPERVAAQIELFDELGGKPEGGRRLVPRTAVKAAGIPATGPASGGVASESGDPVFDSIFCVQDNCW